MHDRDTNSAAAHPPGSWHWLGHDGLDSLVQALAAAGYRVVGPQVADGAVVLRDLASAADLPHGWLDDQDGGHYRLRHDPAAGTFDHVVGPHSLKNFLFPPRETIQRWVREEGGWREETVTDDGPPLAVIGVRGCDLAALAVQDAVFLRASPLAESRASPLAESRADYADPAYAARRQRLFLVAVNCRRAVATCFCHSMGCGPAVSRDAGAGGPHAAAPARHDLALTEMTAPDGGSRFAVEVGSARGAAILEAAATFAGGGSPAAARPAPACSAADVAAARAVPRDLEARMHARVAEPGRPRPRSLDTTDIRDLLFDNLEHPRWQEVAERCLSCTNCTLVCPTCFCHSVAEVADLSGDHVDRERQWASCFALDHGRVHGGNARPTTASRYRQWLTHKLAGWIDQFGTSGCTGCGRCITWCPVGIDITEEVAAIRARPDPGGPDGDADAPPGAPG
jgi:sulfhydrogenase subunit beta (sulfur reductase)